MKLKKIGKFFASMPFAILLLLLLAAICALGSLVPQGQTLSWYLQKYGERTGALVYGLGFDDVFHSLWVLLPTVVLCVNLMLCNLLRLPVLWRRWRAAASPDQPIPDKPTVTGLVTSEPEAVFTRLRMKPAAGERDGKRAMFVSRNALGLWGAWVCHLGILLLIIGFTMGQSTKEVYTVYGVPGQTKPMGETGYSLTFNSFDVDWTEAGNAKQFTTGLTLRAPDGETETGTASVNAPGKLLGYRVYQNSTGPAAKLTVTMDGVVRQEEVLCVGDETSVLETPLMIVLEAYYAGDPENPAGYVYTTYYMGTQDRTGVQFEGDVALEYGTVQISFSEPQSYTLLQIKKDNYTWLVLAGGLITMLGLLLAFYLQPKRVWAMENGDGTWTVSGDCRKGGALFAEQLRAAVTPKPE